ncbi:uncharacterized protein [Choristoneura fumiferana]|uniref:uncharacterized protein n=1 Tax=Choristoneura fumiferana TaxID=7141 RepID=UPI003D15D693
MWPVSLVSLRGARLETQAFHSRCALPPAVVLFHPYDQHIALASKDNFGIWDWGTAAKLCVGSWRKAWGRVTALAYLNAHERALLAVASHAGHLAVYSGLARRTPGRVQVLCGGSRRKAWGRVTALAYLNAHERALLAVASHAGHLAVYRYCAGVAAQGGAASPRSPTSTRTSARCWQWPRTPDTWPCTGTVRGVAAQGVGPRHRARLPQRARARAAGSGLARRTPGRVQVLCGGRGARRGAASPRSPTSTRTSARCWQWPRTPDTWPCTGTVRGVAAQGVGPRHRARLPQRARARAAGSGLARRTPGRVQVLCGGSRRKAWGRVTALAYLNAHERALLAVASHAGHLAVYRYCAGGRGARRGAASPRSPTSTRTSARCWQWPRTPDTWPCTGTVRGVAAQGVGPRHRARLPQRARARAAGSGLARRTPGRVQVLCGGSRRKAWGRVTALAYLNAHERALLAVASHAGHLAVYRPSGSSMEPALVSAWRALDVRPAPHYRPPPAQPIYSLAQLVSEQFLSSEERAAAPQANHVLGGAGAGGAGAGAGGYSAPPPTLLRWCARRRHLALAGLAGSVRVWDAHTELLHADIPTECESAATALWRGSEWEGAGAGAGAGDGGPWSRGFADGSLRAWDERARRRAGRAAPPPRARAVLRAATRQAQAGHRLVSSGGGVAGGGVADGSLRAWDERAPGAQAALHHHRAPCCAARRDTPGTSWPRCTTTAPVLCCAPRHARHKLVTGWSVVGGGSLVAGVADGSLRAWDERAPGAQAALHHHRAPVLCCAPRHARHKLGGGSLVAGVADGSLRAWDERAPGAQAALHHHRAPVLCCAPRHARHKLVTGCMNGEIRIYDTRAMDAPAETLRAPGPLAAVAVHPLLDLIACGSVNQSISLFELGGAPLNTIKFHEGFMGMGARIGPVCCLAFHPLRYAMGVGSKDSTVSVYVRR